MAFNTAELCFERQTRHGIERSLPKIAQPPPDRDRTSDRKYWCYSNAVGVIFGVGNDESTAPVVVYEFYVIVSKETEFMFSDVIGSQVAIHDICLKAVFWWRNAAFDDPQRGRN